MTTPDILEAMIESAISLYNNKGVSIDEIKEDPFKFVSMSYEDVKAQPEMTPLKLLAIFNSVKLLAKVYIEGE